jgi:hypothetical protein
MEYATLTNEQTESQWDSEPAPSKSAAPLPASSQDTGSSRERLKTRKWLLRFFWMPVKVFAYVGLLAVLVFSLLWGLDRLAEWMFRRSQFGQVYPKDISKVRLDFTRPVSHYDYDLVPGVCLVHNQSKGNRYEYANNAGFREPRDIPVEKPADEFRIFLTGGSTAFGLGATGEAARLTKSYQVPYRETISHMMEKILNATAPIPGKTIRVYNTAVWGYSYQHLLMRYIVKLRRYRPDLVVSLDGANEIGPVSRPAKDWNYFEQGQFNGILRQIFAYKTPGLASYLTLWLKNNTYLMTMVWHGNDLFQVIAATTAPEQVSPVDTEEFKYAQGLSQEKRSQMLADHVTAVVRTVENYHSALQNDGVPHIFGLQPLLYLSKKPRHEIEKKVESLADFREVYGIPSDQSYRYIVQRITHSAESKGYFVADFSEYFDDTSQWVFTDWCHLTAGANFLIAKELSNIIKQYFFQQSLSDWDQIDNKDSFFWKMGASAKVVYAPKADEPAHGPRNMLAGYPGLMLYSSEVVSKDQPLEVVLDLHKEFRVSRVRIVWADKESVPEKWACDVSSDGKTWKNWVEGSNKDLDAFSWWPGFEFVGAEYKKARYVRYRPVKYTVRKIRLRCISIQR